MRPRSQFHRLCTRTDRVLTNIGYAAIKPVLIREGVYSELCSKEELDHDTSPCYGQEIRFADRRPLKDSLIDEMVQTKSHVHHCGCCHQRLRVACRHNPRPVRASNLWHHWKHLDGDRYCSVCIRPRSTFRWLHTWLFLPCLRGTLCIHLLLSAFKLLSTALRSHSGSFNRSIRFFFCAVPHFPPHLRGKS